QPEAGLAYTGFWRTGHQLFEKEWPQIVRAFRNHPCIWAWCMGNELFLNELPARETDPNSIRITSTLTNGPLQAVAYGSNGVVGESGTFPTHTFKQSNYYRDLEVEQQGEGRWTLLGNSGTTRVFNDGPHELGLKFISSRRVRVTKIRYYRVSDERGEHTGRL